MIKPILMAAIVVVSPLVTVAAPAQAPRTNPGAACPAGTHYATIRHTLVKSGRWAGFEEAVAAHNAWYATHGSKTTTTLHRIVAPGADGPSLSTTEALTITIYSDAPPPAHDAGYEAFTAQYRGSSALKDEARICL